MTVQTKIKELRTTATDKRLEDAASSKYGSFGEISKGSVEAHQTHITGFFKEGGVKSISNDGMPRNNWVSYGVPRATAKEDIKGFDNRISQGELIEQTEEEIQKLLNFLDKKEIKTSKAWEMALENKNSWNNK